MRTGRISSADAELFYRAFGRPAGRPILILHGADYYDSADWIEVAQALAADREVAVFDQRGFGASSWSPGKDYSAAAQVADIGAVCAHLGWQAPVLLGHSRGGLLALSYAMAMPGQVGGLVLADWAPAPRSAGRDVHAPERVAARDPDFRAGWVAPDPEQLWRELGALRCPALIVRATRSGALSEAASQRVRDELARVEMVELDCDHDLAGEAPDALVAAVQAFIAGSAAVGRNHCFRPAEERICDPPNSERSR